MSAFRIALLIANSALGVIAGRAIAMWIIKRKERNNGADWEPDESGGDTGSGVVAGLASGVTTSAITYAASQLAAITGYGAGGNPGVTEAPGVERVEQAEPFRGWKAAGLLFSHGKLHLTPLNEQFGAYSAGEAVAACHATSLYSGYSYISAFGTPERRSYHFDAPHLDCTCGFHAYKDRAHLGDTSLGYAVLEVDLYGTVIEHELGFRAQKQRVLSATLQDRCFYCPSPVDVLGIHGDGTPLLTGKVLPLCAEHAASARVTVARHHTDSMLGTEVRWCADV